MPAPRRPWPPSRPSRPPSLHESACERASRPQLPFPSSSRGPSCSDNLSSTWRALIGCGCGVNGVEARLLGRQGVWERRRGCESGGGGVSSRRLATLVASGGASGVGARGRRWASARARRRRLGTAARGSSGVERRRRGVKRRRRRLRALATVWRNGGGAKGRRRRHGMEEMRAKQRGKRLASASKTHI